MMHPSDEELSRLSALVDGQLHDDAFAQKLLAIDGDGDADQRWHRYHMIGDVLRTGAAGVAPLDEVFLQKIRLQLHNVAITSVASCADHTSLSTIKEQKSANDSHWRLIAGVASLALVGVIAWQGFAGVGAGESAVLARAPAVGGVAQSGEPVATAAPVSDQPVMLRNAQLDALLAAHRQFGGASAFQAPAGFLRNATFEGQR